MTVDEEGRTTGFWRIPILVAVVAGCLVSAGLYWAHRSSRYPTWKEEVRLSDGRIITIKQKREYFESYGTNRSWVTFTLAEVGGTQTWDSELVPMRVDVQDGIVYVIGSPRGIKQFIRYQAPRHYMVAFKWANDKFVRIPVLDVPESLRREENVFPCVPVSKSELLTLAAKELHWCEPSGDRWRFGKTIEIGDYEAIAKFYAQLSNTVPQSD